MNKLRRQENGQMAILLVMVLPVVFLLFALPLDAGIWFLDHRIAQNQADAAALAAVQYLPATDTTLATAVANTWLVKNGSGPTELACLNYSDLDPVDGRYDTVEVCVRRESPSAFSGLAGLDGIWISTSATAGVIYEQLPVPANLVVLNPTQCSALDVNASAPFTVEGPIMINSECNASAGVFGCSSMCEALSGIESVGGVTTDANCIPCVVTAIPHFEDPLKNLLPPCFPNSPTPCEAVGDDGEPGTLTVRHGSPGNHETFKDPDGFNLQPGIYYGGIKITDGSLAPGIYIMAGGGFEVKSTSSFAAHGVFIYNTNDPDCPACVYKSGGVNEVEVETNGPADLSPMTTGPYAGLLVFQDRASTVKAEFERGFSGTVYIPSAPVHWKPNHHVAVQIIADTIRVYKVLDDSTALYDGNDFYQAQTPRPALIG